MEENFQQAAEWQKAYITDFTQELIGQGHPVDCTLIERGWAEIDTTQDYLRLYEIAEAQGLHTVSTRVETK